MECFIFPINIFVDLNLIVIYCKIEIFASENYKLKRFLLL